MEERVEDEEDEDEQLNRFGLPDFYKKSVLSCPPPKETGVQDTKKREKNKPSRGNSRRVQPLVG